MKKLRMLAALLYMLACLCSAALALEVPSNAVFSPGLKRLAALEKTLPDVDAQAQVSIDKAMYARDLSLLQSMLDGAAIAYQRSSGGEAVTIHRGGEMLGAYAISQNAVLDALEEKLTGVSVLERVPLASIADWLEGLAAGDALAFGFAVSEPFALERTMSDDGTRLTKIKIAGSIAREGEAPWQVSGYLRQPAGRAPKDTFEITFKQDEDNLIELLYSALRENEVTQKNKAGVVSVRTTLKATGKIAGSSVTSRLSVTAKKPLDGKWREPLRAHHGLGIAGAYRQNARQTHAAPERRRGRDEAYHPPDDHGGGTCAHRADGRDHAGCDAGQQCIPARRRRCMHARGRRNAESAAEPAGDGRRVGKGAGEGDLSHAG